MYYMLLQKEAEPNWEAGAARGVGGRATRDAERSILHLPPLRSFLLRF